MTIKEIDDKLEEATNVVGTTKQRAGEYKAMFSTWQATLNNIPTRFGALITEVNGLSSDAWSDAQKAKLARVTAEYQAFLSGIDDAVTALAAITEF